MIDNNLFKNRVIKICTNLEQSKKFTEILAIDSADMYWWHSGKRYYIEAMDDGDFNEDEGHIRAWSLSSLLSFLPPYLFELERGIDLNIYRNINGNGWHVSYMPNNIIDMQKDKFRLITNGDSLIDAAFEMILKLHELKMN